MIAACSATPATAPPPATGSRALVHLATRAQDWIDHTPQVGQNIDCAMSCHTTHMFLAAAPLLGEPSETFLRIRGILEKRVDEAGDLRAATSYYGEPGSAKERESRGTEGVMNATTLALSGSPRASAAFDRMWEVQRADGGFDWLDFGLEPWESKGDWGAALVAFAVGKTSARGHQDNLDKLVAFLRARLRDAGNPMGLHDRVMLLRAAAAMPSLLDAADRDAIVAAIQKARRGDGAWSLADWGRGKRVTEPHDSDAYATAYVALALCEAGQRDPRAMKWLDAHERKDGTWAGASVNTTDDINQLFMSDAATAYAAMARVACR